MRLAIIVPAHNEESNILDIIERVESSINLPHELIVVNDHSEDKTREIVEGLTGKFKNLKLVENKLEKGFANALKTGFSNATAEAVVPVMADLCDDLATIEKMYVKIQEGYDIVCGCRYVKGGARIGGSRLKGFLSSLGGRSLGLIVGFPTHDITNAFKMYRKAVIESMEIESKGFEVSMEIPLKANTLGYRITDIPTVWRERTRGKSTFKILKLLPRYLKLYIWAVFLRFQKEEVRLKK